MRALAIAAVLLLTLPHCALLQAQKKPKNNRSGYDRSARATILHDAIVYVDPDDTTQKIAEVTPGHEVVVIQRSGPWVKVFANTDTPDQGDPDLEPEFATDDIATPTSGWVRDKGIVTPQTSNGDALLFGMAAGFEDLAEQPHPPKGAAQGAHLLYRRVWEYFPDSKLAGEAAWRSADIRWQLDKSDVSTLPSAREQEAYLRPPIYDGEMRRILKTYPGTKYAALAAYDQLDNKLCGDWQGLPKCPEMEATLYMKYAVQFPESPKAAEAQFNAVYRMGVLVTMYKVSDDRKRSEASAQRAQDLAADMHTRFPDSDYTRRAESIAFRIQQGISIYGTDRD
jgi:hypothetical protein